MNHPPQCLVLRLAGPMQSWGARNEFNRRDTAPEPTKSGIVGLLAAATGLRRKDPIEHLVALRLGVRTDQPGTLLRDYHTASTLDGSALPSASVNAKGVQKRTSPAKQTYVTTRMYLQDAVFVAVVEGPPALLATLADALRRPAFPLALGRRCCPVTQPLVLPGGEEAYLWDGDPPTVLAQVPWQGRPKRSEKPPVRLPATVDAEPDAVEGEVDLRPDVPVTFDPYHRRYTIRRVRQLWVSPPGCMPPGPDAGVNHDPFALLGW